jgi:hypothetical protein
MKLHVGQIAVNNGAMDDVVLWRDTAPDNVDLVCLSADAGAELRVWNCWRDERGTMQAWIGNAGIRAVHTSADSVTLECNSRPEVTFDDLVFDLVFDEAA